MSKLKLYGISGSRALRSLWMAEELGLDYEHVPIHFAKEAKTPEYGEINPNQKIPAIDDDGFKLWESMAINFYLAKKHGGDLAPKTLEEEAVAVQWSVWGMAECEKLLLAIVLRLPSIGMMPPDEAVTTAAKEDLKTPLGVLDRCLDGHDYLMGGRFTVADLNLASILSWCVLGGVDLGAVPNVQSWLERCTARPALARAQEK